MILDRPVTVLVCALGGEGGGVLAEWLVDAAAAAGHSAQSTSIPGVAQRTGATTYYVEVFPQPDAALGGRRPVFSLTPVPGALDLLVSSELLETVRQIGNGMTDAARTRVVSARDRSLTTAEKMQLADGRADPVALMQIVRAHTAEAVLLDMATLAQRAGTVVSAVLFGAIAASGVLPFGAEVCRATIRAGGKAGKGVDASLRGFDAAIDAIATLRAERAAVAEAIGAVAGAPLAVVAGAPLTAAGGAPAASASPVASLAPAAPLATPAWLQPFPEAVREVVALGHARALEYQDARYAARYLERVQRVLVAERAGDPAGANGFVTTRETARHLAVWMAFDDIVRVAALKCRAARFERVRGEVRAGAADLVRVHDHFKPGVAEFAALLPTRTAEALLRWEQRRAARGRAPWQLPLKLPSHGVLGLLALRALAALKPLRPRGSRFAAEQAEIERWLDAVERGARESAELGRELAECGRLVKGYGATNERGKENLLHVIAQLAAPTRGDNAPTARAAAIAAARRAALADDAGRALDTELVRQGAAPRPVKAQPIRWVRQRPGGRAGA